MTFDRPGPVERASRIWPLDNMPKDGRADGPVVLLKQVMAIAWRYKIRLIGCIATGIVLAALYAHSLPRTYNATATMLLEPRQFANNSTAVLQQGLDLNSAESELQILLSERLLSAVFESLRLYESPELGPHESGMVRKVLDDVIAFVRGAFGSEPAVGDPDAPDRPTAPSAEENLKRIAFANFVDRVYARRVGQSYVVEVGYWSTDPAEPARVANAIISGYILQSVIAKEQTAQAGTETLQGRLDALASQVSAASEAMAAGTLPKVPTPDADAKITGAALYPLSPSSPRTSLIVAFGGVLGLFCGMTALAMSVAFDRKVRLPKDLQLETALPCLATIPETSAGAAMARIGVRSRNIQRQAGALRDLRTLIDIACVPKKGERHVVIALAGCSRDTGASALSLSLADMLARSGRPASVFWCEPQAQGSAGAPASLLDIAGAERNDGELNFEYHAGVGVLPILSREPLVNAYANFRSPRIREIIDAARFKGDVIIELPALDTSLDALALASHADAVLIVARWGRTTREAVKEAEHQFRRAGVNLIGYVINRRKS
ncbi:Wzz/FepE/Etk N-terminal domain-containing protein [Neorhizobium sp. NCHU2750]|uniref:Wzz/FepE/Etk N-terminal domain-containing protein n=1 Tax=Neorhizobium sp. NCHU2750 TaxID=1825976 RepID=UPI000E7635B3|nr:exopolysaccharide biosynthesis protein [Neorhizobium sp. NCHU2750]